MKKVVELLFEMIISLFSFISANPGRSHWLLRSSGAGCNSGYSRMVSQPGVKIVFVSLTEDQAKLIISVAHEHLVRNYKSMIAKGKDKPTLTQITLKNKSNTKVRPVGQTGNAVRGFDGHILGVDEAPWQPDMMWKAARPIISTNDGEIWMWGTPADDSGYFYEQFDKAYNKKDPNARYKVWYKNTEEVLEERPICASWTQKQRDGLKRILAEEKADMTTDEYGNEYLGLFLSDLKRFFDDDWIEKVCTEDYKPHMKGNRYLGVDIGRMYDPSTFEDFGKIGDVVYQIDHQQTQKTFTNETQDKIIALNQAVNYRQIGIDAGSGALGVGVYDNLMIVSEVKRKLIPMNNRAIALDRDGKKKQRIQKIDYYNNLKAMGQNRTLKLLKDDAVKASLRSVRWSYPKDETGLSKMNILGNNLHIVEGMIRGAYLASKDKYKKFFISYM